MAAFGDITLEDMRVRFGEEEIAELGARAGADGDSNPVIERALADARSRAAAIISRRFDLRKAPPKTAASLRQPIADIARYIAYDDAVPETIKNRHDAALSYLKDLAARKAEISDEDDALLTAWDLIDGAQGSQGPGIVGAVRNSGSRVFTRESLSGYGQDTGRGRDTGLFGRD